MTLAVALMWTLAASRPPVDSQPTLVVVLGVDHSAQLVSPGNRPGMLAAFMDRLRPDAVCIERAPELAARADWYEFTYEVQGIVVPWAKAHGVPLCPIDWMPSVDDQMLAFGLDLDQPPEIRPASGFQAFLTFPDSTTLRQGLFAAEDSATVAPSEAWARTPASAARDFPRRLFLYRTFLQARRIRAAAKAHPGGTVLVVIGYFHKPEVERILAADPAIAVVRPSSIGLPSETEADRATTRSHRAAILSFNLLGLQAETGVVDWKWVGRMLSEFEGETPGPEAALFRVRYELLTGTLTPADATVRLRDIRARAGNARFTWSGVKDQRRLDSCFDPFGNLTVAQRATVELARVLARTGVRSEAERLLTELATRLGDRMAGQLRAYVARLPGLEPQTRP